MRLTSTGPSEIPVADPLVTEKPVAEMTDDELEAFVLKCRGIAQAPRPKKERSASGEPKQTVAPAAKPKFSAGAIK